MLTLLLHQVDEERVGLGKMNCPQLIIYQPVALGIGANEHILVSVFYKFPNSLAASSCKSFQAAMTWCSSVSGAPTTNRKTNLPERT
jgi:hypothetical protein